MYEAFFNLKTLPFENTPNPQFFFASEEHREALAAIEYTIRMRKGYVCITGPVGTGKTTVSRTMISRCEDNVHIVPILHGHENGTQLLRQILRAVEVTYRANDDHAVLLEKLFTYLHEQLAAGEPVVLLVDDAHMLSDQTLEELRLLSNYESNRDKLVQVVLVGQNELIQRLNQTNMAALKQRIAMSQSLKALNIQETAAYIGHRIRVASIDPQNLQVHFPGRTLEAIYKLTRGIPRLVNYACDNCMLLASIKNEREITPLMVQTISKDLSLHLKQTEFVSSTSEAPRLALAGNM
ncbi:MAG: AAA family ATPase [Phycisphaeraceae bacterium]|nr:AAA family ATPase [Phycisphaeraceae bacterium]